MAVIAESIGNNNSFTTIGAAHFYATRQFSVAIHISLIKYVHT